MSIGSNLIQRDCGNFHDPAEMLDCWIVPSSVAWLVPVWPWRARRCLGCGEVVADWGWFGTVMFEWLVGWWWDGGLVVREGGDD